MWMVECEGKKKERSGKSLVYELEERVKSILSHELTKSVTDYRSINSTF